MPRSCQIDSELREIARRGSCVKRSRVEEKFQADQMDRDSGQIDTRLLKGAKVLFPSCLDQIKISYRQVRDF